MKEYQQLLADIDVCEARDAGVNAAKERFREFAQIAADKVKERLLLASAGSGDFGPHELLFAAGARCECGAGSGLPRRYRDVRCMALFCNTDGSSASRNDTFAQLPIQFIQHKE